jgi:large subunit ribosomal protein L9
MAKRVQVVLNEDIKSLGNDGDLVEVAPGFARNFLLPNKKALPVTPTVLKQVEHRRAKQAEKEAAKKQEAIDFQTALTTIGRFTVKKTSRRGWSLIWNSNKWRCSRSCKRSY